MILNKWFRKDSCRSGCTRVLSQYFTAVWCLNTLPVLFRQEGHACWRKATAPAIVKLSCLPLKSRWSRQIINICIVTGPAHPPPPKHPTLSRSTQTQSKKICSHSKRRGERVDSEGHRPNKFWKQILFPLQPVFAAVHSPSPLCPFSHDLKLNWQPLSKWLAVGWSQGAVGLTSLRACVYGRVSHRRDS